ncbi:MAG TPA: hypothetical protein VL443_10685 [Cyclobacteriaceae bacterium]|jgi:hypothetical protein|nr:hypothetical protein [Cyclobacteriaceae bacterium]
MKSFSSVLACLLLLTYSAFSQDYVVTIKGDTLRGKVKTIMFGPDKKVTVTGANKKKTTVSLFQTKAYSVKGETYHPVKGDKGYTFMKLIKPGYLSLYGFQLENQTSFDGLYLLKKDGHGVEVPNLTFKKTMLRFLSDSPEVTAKIEDGTLGKQELDEIIDAYNSYIDSKSKSQQQAIAVKKEQLKGIGEWEAFEEKVKAEPNFEGKSTALEMISEVKNKVKNSEKIPNFLSEGLKGLLQNTSLKEELAGLLSTN